MEAENTHQIFTGISLSYTESHTFFLFPQISSKSK